MDIELLRTFIAVADNGSFTRAASQIYRSQSAISMQIKRLEQQLERSLFQRNARSLKLTLDGRALVPYARKLLTLHDEAMNNIFNRNDVNHLRIGCPDDYSSKLLPDLIQILRNHIPGLHVSLINANSTLLRQHLDNGELDITVLTRPANSHEGIVIKQEKGVWVCSDPQLIQQRPLPLALFEPQCKFHSTVIDGLEKRGINYEIVCEGSNSALLSELVRRNCAVSVMASSAVANDLIQIESSQGLPELPVVEIVLCVTGAKQHIKGISLTLLAEELRQC